MNRKPTILLCDDELKVTGLFKQRHGGELTSAEISELKRFKIYDEELAKEDKKWDVVAINEGTKLEEKLNEMKMNNEMPDIILIDQQYKGDNHTEEKEVNWKSSGKRLIDEIKYLQNLEIQSNEDGVYENRGIDYLRLARRICPNTPIAIYTSYGLALANNKTLEDVAREKGEWIKKGETRRYEDLRLNNMLRTKSEVPKEFENKIFFISPFGKEKTVTRAHSDYILEEVLHKLDTEPKMTFTRALEIENSSSIIKDMYKHIFFSKILIVDIVGLNPNVLIEIGLAFAWGKCPIIIAPEGMKKLPFNLPHDYPIVFYDYTTKNGKYLTEDVKNYKPKFASKLREDLSKRLREVIDNDELLKYKDTIELLDNYK